METGLQREASSSKCRKSFIAQHYAAVWLKLAPKYGISSYHKQLMDLLTQLVEKVSPPPGAGLRCGQWVSVRL